MQIKNRKLYSWETLPKEVSRTFSPAMMQR